MRNNRFQNHVSESSITLPICMVIGTLMWFWKGEAMLFDANISMLGAMTMGIIATYIVLETANVYALLRIRSRMISCVWIICITIAASIHNFSEGWISAVAIAGSYYVMFSTYQKHEPVVGIFHSFLLLSIASLAVPQLVIFVPFYYWYQIVFLRCLTWRVFWAGIVGMLLPPCFALGWCIATNNYDFLVEWITTLRNTELFVATQYRQYLSYKNPETLNMGFFTILSLVSIVHYLRNYYNDKIRTRMYLYIYVMQTTICWLMLACSPNLQKVITPVFLINASTMIGHYFALTGSVLSNLFFCTTLIGSIFLLIINSGIWTL